MPASISNSSSSTRVSLEGERFQSRHIGPDAAERDAMLAVIGAPSIDTLIDEAIPDRIRLRQPLAIADGQSEYQFLRDLRRVAARNQVFRSFIGLGYYDTITPSVILRNVLENPGWYTPYTPYQAEIAQGRLESLLNFQTVVRDLTGMEIANGSLLDEATAAAEAMTMLHRVQAKRVDSVVGPAQFLVADSCYPQTIDLLQSRAEPLGIEVIVMPIERLMTTDFSDRVFGALVQSPDESGRVHDLREFIRRARHEGVLVAVGTDLLSLVLLTPPGEMGADVVYGNSQRFGVPLGYGGPHAAFFATLEKHIRQAPGRIIGVSVDAQGNTAYRMALQTREQHIRREKATSNICTAQALLANIAGLYAVYHGPNGLSRIARRVHAYAAVLERELSRLGLRQLNDRYFDTVLFEIPGAARPVDEIVNAALASNINLGVRQDRTIRVALDETVDQTDITAIVAAFAVGLGKAAPASLDRSVPRFDRERLGSLARTSPFLTHPVFNKHHSETEMMHYIRQLERKDVGLDTSMIPLGSCTMKLNAASEMLPITWPEFGKIHPFAPVDQAEGYLDVFRELESMLAEITGFAAVSLQPNSGAQGEFAGLMVIRAYHRDRGEIARDGVLIPASAHGTNPVRAAIAGLRLGAVGRRNDGRT